MTTLIAGVDVPLAVATTVLPAPGQTLDAFIAALTNQTVDSCGGFPAGQCTALACAWCRNLGLGTPCDACGSANKCDGKCWAGGSYSGWTWITHSPGGVPSPGDLVVYEPCASEQIGASGHVGIFVSGNASSFTGFDQNWAGAYCALHQHDYACVLGWQHPTHGCDCDCPGGTCDGACNCSQSVSPPPSSSAGVIAATLIGSGIGLGAFALYRSGKLGFVTGERATRRAAP